MEILIEGWFYNKDMKKENKSKDKKKETEEIINLQRAVLPKDFIKSAGKFETDNLVIIEDFERIVGSFFNPTFVVGVIDANKSKTPFFIEKNKVQKLKDLQRDRRISIL